MTHIDVTQNTNNGIIIHIHFKDDTGQYSDEPDIKIIASKRTYKLSVAIGTLSSDRQLDSRTSQVLNIPEDNNEHIGPQIKTSKTIVSAKAHQQQSQMTIDSPVLTDDKQIINKDQTSQTNQQLATSAFIPIENNTKKSTKNYYQCDDESLSSNELPALPL